jgi:hypothetical protein
MQLFFKTRAVPSTRPGAYRARIELYDDRRSYLGSETLLSTFATIDEALQSAKARVDNFERAIVGAWSAQ